MKIAVYCGSGCGNDKAYEAAAEKLGAWIGEQGHTLVYGGGNTGLMGITAKNTKEKGSKVIGVVPGDVDFICSRPQPYCTEVIVAKNMSQRKEKMLELADAFVALPGGIGTIDEISEAITLTKIGVFNKKAIMFNTNNFYEPFKQLVEKMCSADFLKPSEMAHVLYSDNLDEIQKFLSK